MIDLHSHILPGVDDGAPDWDTALAMLGMAARAGTKTIVATPHSHDLWRHDTAAARLIPQLAREANRRAAQADLDIVVLPGQECMIDPHLPADLTTGRWLTLGRSRTVLLELPFSMWPPFTENLIFDLQVAGYTVLLAHPERYTAVRDDPSRLVSLVEKGVLGQVTTTSILGQFGERTQTLARLLLQHNLAHVIASDAHTTRGRSPTLDKALRQAAEWIGLEAAQRLVLDTPRALLLGETVQVPAPLAIEPARKSRGLFGLFST